MIVCCPSCNQKVKLTPDRWCCECGEAWEPLPQDNFDTQKIDGSAYGLWRYGSLFGLDQSKPEVSLGAGWTPLLPLPIPERQVFLKVEYLSPTGSFKDRGTEIEINTLLQQNVTTVMDDSAGNAGSSLAAYAVRAGMKARIFVPDYASENKKKQIAIYGAEVHSILGMRIEAKKAAIAAVSPGCVYASHAYHPCFLLGQESVAWEVWEQLGRRAPDWFVVPVGQGVHLLGAWLGFVRLKKAGLIEKVPRMVAVQPTLLNPVVSAVQNSWDAIPDLNPTRPSIAEGLAIAKPVRWRRILQAIRESDGSGYAVEESAIIAAQAELARYGFYAEPTSATVFAAIKELLKQAKPADLIVASLTGSGLKGVPKLG